MTADQTPIWLLALFFAPGVLLTVLFGIGVAETFYIGAALGAIVAVYETEKRR